MCKATKDMSFDIKCVDIYPERDILKISEMKGEQFNEIV
jgi:hypothetical protein